jgi:hypothetical protein
MRVRIAISELEAIALHARRARRALEMDPIDRIDARTEIAYILAAVADLRAIYDELGKPPSPTMPPAA